MQQRSAQAPGSQPAIGESRGAREVLDQPLMCEEQFGDSQLMAAVLAGDVRLSSLFIFFMLFQI